MGNGNAATEVPIIERGCAPVHFVNGFAEIKDLGNGNTLFTFFRRDGNSHEVEVKLICHSADGMIMCQQAETYWLMLRKRSQLVMLM